MDIETERSAFLAGRRRKTDEAQARLSLMRFAGVELDAARSCETDKRAALAGRLRRLMERERLRGMARHWSYDLNRHIGLKQALDELGA